MTLTGQDNDKLARRTPIPNVSTYDLNKGMVGGSCRMKQVVVSTKILIYSISK